MDHRTGPSWNEPHDWPADAQKESIIGDWCLYQRTGGHRSSTDDVLTAYFAAYRYLQLNPKSTPTRYLDLGCGVGSVLLMLSHRLRPASVQGIEAQPQSVLMARRSVSELPADAPPIQIIQGDIRDSSHKSEPFAIVTGSPPYFPLGTGTLPPDPQRRACRFEARGGIEAYCQAAALHLADDARFYVVFQTTWRSRVEAAARANDLEISAGLQAHMRQDRNQPFLDVFEMTRRQAKSEAQLGWQSFAIRDAKGHITPEYRRAREFLGLQSSL